MKFRCGILLVASGLLAAPGSAQTLEPVPDSTGLPRGAVPYIGGVIEERDRLAQILGHAETGGYLVRSTSSRLTRTPAAGAGVRFSVLTPTVTSVWNSSLPFSMNDGAMWAGRGMSVAASVGFRADAGPVRLVIAPQIIRSENRDFHVFRGRDSTRSGYSSPWYAFDRSADLPLRFGNQPTTLIDAGQSSLSVHAGPVVFGAATENQWWGPGIRNAIVLSNQAAGFPHLFLRTAAPLRTPLGDLEARWIVGSLAESLYFDTLEGGSRSLSGFVGTVRPGRAGLTLGVARVVYALSSGGEVASHAFDVFLRRGAYPAGLDTIPTEGPEQITSVFGRWVLPGDGAEVYAEWARSALPGSVTDLLQDPNHSQGYTLGGQWARETSRGAALRVQAELTYLEMSPTSRRGRVPTFYTSASIPQGYTHRGQVLGASIGPGSSGQWMAADYLARGWRGGLFAGRVRWDDDAHILTAPPSGAEHRHSLSHDVSVFGGARGGIKLGPWDLGAELTVGERLNYLFQNPDLPYGLDPPPGSRVDVGNTTLRLTLSPAP